jgi:hypothetical protein
VAVAAAVGWTRDRVSVQATTCSGLRSLPLVRVGRIVIGRHVARVSGQRSMRGWNDVVRDKAGSKSHGAVEGGGADMQQRE